MKKILTIVILLAILVLCSRYLIFSKHIPKPNPLTYTYDFPIELVRKKVSETFSSGASQGMYVEIGYNKAESQLNGISPNENRNNFFINRIGFISSGESIMYYNFWGRLTLYPSYHIILDSISETRTRIRIESFPKVKTGPKIETNHGIPYLSSYRVYVKPSTIEEYEIIRSIGNFLGQKNMPPVIMP